MHRLLTSRVGVEHARNQENLTPPSPDADLSVDQAAGDRCVRGSASGGLGVIVYVHPLEVPLHVPSRAYRRRARRGAELQHQQNDGYFVLSNKPYEGIDLLIKGFPLVPSMIGLVHLCCGAEI